MTATSNAMTPATSIRSGEIASLAWDGLAITAARDGVPLSHDQLAAFDTYRRLLHSWSTHTNLTAIHDASEIERRLFVDALRLVPAIDTLCADRATDTTI